LLESNEAATTMNMVLYTMTELATWDCTHKEIVDRSLSPWDNPNRRPSCCRSCPGCQPRTAQAWHTSLYHRCEIRRCNLFMPTTFQPDKEREYNTHPVGHCLADLKSKSAARNSKRSKNKSLTRSSSNMKRCSSSTIL